MSNVKQSWMERVAAKSSTVTKAPKVAKESSSTPYRAIIKITKDGKQYALPVTFDLGNIVNYADTWVERMNEDQLQGHARATEIMGVLDQLDEDQHLTEDMLEDYSFDIEFVRGSDKTDRLENARQQLAEMVSIPKLK